MHILLFLSENHQKGILVIQKISYDMLRYVNVMKRYERLITIGYDRLR